MGGVLTEQARTNPQNLAGKAVEVGIDRSLTKGDFLLVPNGTPHSFTKINGELIIISLRLPRASQ